MFRGAVLSLVPSGFKSPLENQSLYDLLGCFDDKLDSSRLRLVFQEFLVWGNHRQQCQHIIGVGKSAIIWLPSPLSESDMWREFCVNLISVTTDQRRSCSCDERSWHVLNCLANFGTYVNFGTCGEWLSSFCCISVTSMAPHWKLERFWWKHYWSIYYISSRHYTTAVY